MSVCSHFNRGGCAAVAGVRGVVAAVLTFAPLTAGAIPPPDRQPPGSTQPAATQPEALPAQPRSRSVATESAAAGGVAGSQPAAGDAAQVAIHVPSMARLVQAGRDSHTAVLYEAIADSIGPIGAESEEDFDIAALLAMLRAAAAWPDTSLTMTVYAQDAEGRARWAVRLQWPLDELHARVAALLEIEGARRVLGDVSIRRLDDGAYELALPETPLAYLCRDGHGSIVKATRDMTVADTEFDRPDAAGTATTDSGRAGGPLLMSQQVVGQGGALSAFGALSGISSIRYELSLDEGKCWNEQIKLGWNILLGAVAKVAVRKVARPFECPQVAYVSAAIHLEGGEQLADQFIGLGPNVVSPSLGGEMAIAVTPGTGFLPLPDTVFQWNLRSAERAFARLRSGIEKDAAERRADDRPLAWHEEEIDGRTVFWKDGAADLAAGFLPLAVNRTVVFADKRPGSDGSTGERLVIVQTSNQAADALRHWRELVGTPEVREKVPSSTRAHWQAVVHWDNLYALAQPWLSAIASLTSGEGSPPPAPAAIAAALPDSVIDIRTEFAGLKARHVGPVPVGLAYLPLIVGEAVGQGADPRSEAARQQVACRHLRVLHHHASLFHKDYGRWPASVAELEGYVDFASHPHLLYLRPQETGAVAQAVAGFQAALGIAPRDRTRGSSAPADPTDDDAAVDDGLYEITGSGENWRLGIRAGQFKNLKTIQIDARGEIHRVPRTESDDKKLTHASPPRGEPTGVTP